MSLENAEQKDTVGDIRIAVLHLSHIANFDDIDPLAAEPDVSVIWVARGDPIPGDAIWSFSLAPRPRSLICTIFVKRAGHRPGRSSSPGRKRAGDLCRIPNAGHPSRSRGSGGSGGHL